MPRGAYEWFGNAAHGNGALGRAFVAGRRVRGGARSALPAHREGRWRIFLHGLGGQLTAATHDWITRSLAPDLESFQRHSKRGTIGVEDVLLAARKNATTKALIAEHVDEIAASKQKKRRRSDAAAAADEDEADDT